MGNKRDQKANPKTGYHKLPPVNNYRDNAYRNGGCAVIIAVAFGGIVTVATGVVSVFT